MAFPRLTQLIKVLGRDLAARDAVSRERIAAAEARLGLPLPGPLADLYLCAGAAPEFQEHDSLREPESLALEDGFLVFMEENQRIVDWGVRVPLGGVADPEVWQRVHADRPEWYSEEMPLSRFIVRRLAFTRGVTLTDDLI